MTSLPRPPSRDEEFWREFLTQGGDSMKGIGRRLFRRIPADPRCRMCAAPFAGPGARVMRLVGKRQSDANPNWCNSCIDFMTKHHGGAEVSGAMLVSSDAAAAAGLDAGIARRKLELKGKEFATEVISLRVDPPAAQPPP